MQLPTAFNAQEHNPSQSAGSLPIGKHAVVIESSEVKSNKANDGGYIQLNLMVTEGPQAGSKGPYRLNMYHSNPQVVEIANKQFSAVCHVTGIFNVQDSQQLHNIPFMIEVAPQKNKPEYTEVKRVFDAAGNEPGKAPAAPAAPVATQAAPASVPTAGWPAAAPAAAAAPAQAEAPAAPAPASGTAPATSAPPWGQPQG